jgi:hypothetical protein
LLKASFEVLLRARKRNIWIATVERDLFKLFNGAPTAAAPQAIFFWGLSGRQFGMHRMGQMRCFWAKSESCFRCFSVFFWMLFTFRGMYLGYTEGV